MGNDVDPNHEPVRPDERRKDQEKDKERRNKPPRDRQQELLDVALEESFPASDPPGLTPRR